MKCPNCGNINPIKQLFTKTTFVCERCKTAYKVTFDIGRLTLAGLVAIAFYYLVLTPLEISATIAKFFVLAAAIFASMKPVKTEE